MQLGGVSYEHSNGGHFNKDWLYGAVLRVLLFYLRGACDNLDAQVIILFILLLLTLVADSPVEIGPPLKAPGSPVPRFILCDVGSSEEGIMFLAYSINLPAVILLERSRANTSVILTRRGKIGKPNTLHPGIKKLLIDEAGTRREMLWRNCK